MTHDDNRIDLPSPPVISSSCGMTFRGKFLSIRCVCRSAWPTYTYTCHLYDNFIKVFDSLCHIKSEKAFTTRELFQYRFWSKEHSTMLINTDIFFDFIGRLKIATVIVGLINLILIGNSYYSYDSRDEAFLVAVIVCFIISFLWIFGVLFEYFVVTDTIIRIDIVYHVIASLILAATDVFFLISLLKYGHNGEDFVTRLFSMMFGFINSAIYGYLPWKLLKAG